MFNSMTRCILIDHLRRIVDLISCGFFLVHARYWWKYKWSSMFRKRSKTCLGNVNVRCDDHRSLEVITLIKLNPFGSRTSSSISQSLIFLPILEISAKPSMWQWCYSCFHLEVWSTLLLALSKLFKHQSHLHLTNISMKIKRSMPNEKEKRNDPLKKEKTTYERQWDLARMPNSIIRWEGRCLKQIRVHHLELIQCFEI